ncbi:tetratricopeptide (TPR) repeat protein [Streptomyces zagrosensis]|uniref:Tetratricopeptide (TPR) repeat protein n=1 Tax=Streptomyces zagrosensis TaxID=1042984 RepID=A0A7W9QC84_9ACTN|nr:tetratricopeptide (TPR) repeat protein [Streptomyces zagrosensis]
MGQAGPPASLARTPNGPQVAVTGPARPVTAATTPQPDRAGSDEPLGRFSGRRRELAGLRADIGRAGLDTLSGRKAPRSRVLLIAGRPGSGRTALAEAFLALAAGSYPDGVLRAALTTPDGAPVPIARTARDLLAALGAAAPPGAAEDELIAALRAALMGRRALLFLDDAGSAEQVDALLPDAPDCLVLVVSQGPLTGVPDVRPCTIGGLDSAAAVALLGCYAGSTRITCDPVAATTVVEECGAQPAALALVGGWLAARPQASVSDAAAKLREVTSDAGVEQSGRPLARALHLAYASLPDRAARILRLLALAPGGWADAHTASALAGCSVQTAQDTLAGFLAHGLLRPLPPDGAARTPAGDVMPPRYQLPGCLVPSLAALLREHERAAEIELARARMLERTVRLLHSARLAAAPDDAATEERTAELPAALRFPTRADAARWLRSRQPALLAAARLAVQDGGLDTLARRLLAALTHALAAHRGADGAAPELYELHELVLDVANRRELPLERAAALLNLGDLDARAGRADAALARYRGALKAARGTGDAYAIGRSLESIGATYHELGDWHRAADWYGRALELRLTRGELTDQARLYGRLGAVHACAGRWSEALRGLRASVAAYRRLGDRAGHARALSEVARVQEHAGRPQEALRTCQEALEYARLAGDVRSLAAVRLRLAETLERLGDRPAAELHRREAARYLEPPIPRRVPPAAEALTEAEAKDARERLERDTPDQTCEISSTPPQG